jgi:hypothetical protein
VSGTALAAGAAQHRRLAPWRSPSQPQYAQTPPRRGTYPRLFFCAAHDFSRRGLEREGMARFNACPRPS